jgi:sulfane dehydrogenase subunit SoxC
MGASGPTPEHTPSDPGRRRFLGRGATLGAALLTGAGRPASSQGQAAPADPSKVLGRHMVPYTERSRFEQAAKAKGPPTMPDEWGGNFTPLGESLGIITPSSLFYEVHRSGVADIDPRTHRLLIHGMVDRPVILSMDEIRRLPSVSRTYFLECSGNTQTEWGAPTAPTVQWTHGLTSCAEWTGVPLSLLLREAGVQKGATWILAEGADGSGNERSLPMRKAMDDILVAYGQNGEALRPENGYPLRLVVPGWEGNVNVKWLRRLTVTDRPYMTRIESMDHTSLMPGGKARHFTFVMEAKSVITFPSGGQRLPGPGFYEITGLAWSGRGRVRRVDVSIDGGKTWRAATLQEPILPFAHTRFRFPWRWGAQETVLQSRCVDETGYVQPTLAALVKVRGLNSTYHNNAIQAWKVAADGSVHNARA